MHFIETLKSYVSFFGSSQLFATFALFVLIFFLRLIAMRIVRRTGWATDQLRLRWVLYVRTLAFIILLLGLVIVWSSELRTLALSIVAIAAAVVLATKELIACVLGSFARAGSGAFSIGDRIEMQGMRGDVIDMGLLGTTILEVGSGHQRTGRSVFIPNSLFLSSQTLNETFTEKYVLHVIQLPLPKDSSWEQAEEALIEAAMTVCEEFIEPAREYMHATAKKYSLPIPSVEPRVVLHFPESDRLHLILRVPTPAQERGRTEQKILRHALNAQPHLFLEDSNSNSPR